MKTARILVLLAVGLWLNAAPAGAAQLDGRLFSTPAERARLDHLRQTSKQPDPEQAQMQAEEGDVDWTPPPAVIPESVSVQGYVKRSDGKKGTVWVNERPLQENSEAGDLRVGKLPPRGNQIEIDLPANGKRLKLKAGQIYLPETDSVSEDKARVIEREVGRDAEAGVDVP